MDEIKQNSDQVTVEPSQQASYNNQMKPLQSQISRFDLAVTRQIQSWPAWLHPLMTGVSLIGHPGTVTVVAASLLAWNVLKRNYELAIVAFASLASLIISAILKEIWKRTRPDTAQALGLHTYSFPSGHSYGSTVIYGLLAYLAWRHLPAPWNGIVPSLLVLLILTVGISRVYLGAHYPTDVLGGWLLGVIILLIIIKAGRI